MKTTYLPLRAIGFLFSASLLSSCEKEINESPTSRCVDRTNADAGWVFKKRFYRGIPITYEIKDGKAIWQGDILFTAQDLAAHT